MKRARVFEIMKQHWFRALVAAWAVWATHAILDARDYAAASANESSMTAAQVEQSTEEIVALKEQIERDMRRRERAGAFDAAYKK